MWETPAASASSSGLCEGWDSFTVPRFAWPVISTAENPSEPIPEVPMFRRSM